MSRWMEALTIERGGFRIRVPESWWEFDVRPESRDDGIRQMVNDRVRRNPELAEQRGVLEAFLRKAAKDAWASGALYCGCMAETFGGEVPVTGSITVSLLDALRAGRGADALDLDRRDLPPGVEDVKIPGDDRTIRAVLMQTFIPVPGQEGKVALVAGSSQVLDLADSFFDVFDAITSTFRFVGE